MKLRVRLDRWYLGLHGLAMLRGWPFEDAVVADARMQEMRDLLAGEGEAVTYEDREIDVLDTAAAYRDWAATYDEPNALIVAEEQAVREVLGAFPPGRALDVAAGTGRLAAMLVELGHMTVAVDVSVDMLARARLSGARLVAADLGSLPLASGSFDLVTCALALTHVPDLGPALEEFARVVAPGGSVVVSDIHPLSVATGGHAFFRRADGSRAVTRNEIHWPSAYITAAVGAGLRVTACVDALVDEAVLEAFAAEKPLRAVLGLPFASIWVFSK